MNKLVLNFATCSPVPSKGYNIKYRIAGTSDPYTNAGNFFVSPAIFYDTINPAGTCYEGLLASDCSPLLGNPVSWNSCIPDSGDPDPCVGSDAKFCTTTHVSSDSMNVKEIANIGGLPGSTVTVTMDTYANSNGGVVKVNNFPAFIGNFWFVVLDGLGYGSLPMEINGSPNPSTAIMAHFTITAVSAGAIGTPDAYQISKVFF